MKRQALAKARPTALDTAGPALWRTDASVLDIAEEPSWFPAVENRGEGLFLRLRTEAVGCIRSRTS